MTQHIWSAHEIATTRLCAARECGDDALTGWSLCGRHDRQHRAGTRVELHSTPAPLEPTLRCSKCNHWKVDDEFPMRAAVASPIGGRTADRRGRYCYCLACEPSTHLRQAQPEGETAA